MFGIRRLGSSFRALCTVACLVPGRDTSSIKLKMDTLIFVVEKTSSIRFPGSVADRSSDGKFYILMATGVRRVFLGLQAYAAGIYIESPDKDLLSAGILSAVSYTIRIGKFFILPATVC